MRSLRLFVEEIRGEWYGWPEICPGATCRGATPEEAARNAMSVPAEYIEWLTRRGETLPMEVEELAKRPFLIEVVETHPAMRTDDGSEVNAFFAFYRGYMTHEERERLLRLLRCAREDLRDALSLLPPDMRNAAPFGGWSANYILHRVAEEEECLIHLLGGERNAPQDNDPVTRLEAVRAAFESAVRAVPARKRSAILLHKGEQWTLRKMLLRAVWHERYHAAQLAARSNPSEYLRSIVVDARLRGETVHAPAW